MQGNTNQTDRKKTGANIVFFGEKGPVWDAVQRCLDTKHSLKRLVLGSKAPFHTELVLVDARGRSFALPKQRNAATPTLVFLEQGGEAVERALFAAGAKDYLLWPCTDALLRRRIEGHLCLLQEERGELWEKESLHRMAEEQLALQQNLQDAIVGTLADLVELRDHSTGGHIRRTKCYVGLMLDGMKKLGIYQEEYAQLDRKKLLQAAQLHDIGKVSIPDLILKKSGLLTPEERAVMQTHVTEGYHAIVKAMELTREKDFLSLAAPVALYHHEKWDGTGYPVGLSGEKIPLPARIMAIVDVYDTLVTELPYRKKLTHEEAIARLQAGSGSDFDPLLIKVLLVMEQEFFQAHAAEAS